MSLIYLWINKNPQIRTLNLIHNDNLSWQFNSDIGGKEQFERNEFKTSFLTGLKKVKFINNFPYLIDKKGKVRKVNNLHFIGVSKLMMHDIYMNNRMSINTYFVMVYYYLKRYVGKLYRGFKR